MLTAIYKEVWRTPAMQLAKKYGLSDVGLAKICKRMNIPLPPRGHWAKQAYGYKMKTPPLPPMDSKGVKQVMLDKSAQELLDIAKNRLSTSQLRFKDRQNIQRLQKEMNDWEMSQRIRIYVAAMRTTDSATDATDPEFLTWAETYADHLDPTVDFRIEILDTP